jgi:antitoxin ParD1/3/4
MVNRYLANFCQSAHFPVMATRNINLTDALDRFVAERIESGEYQNASEVVRAGLRLLKAEEAARAAKIAALNAAIQEGIDSDEGEVIDVDQLGPWLEQIDAEARAEVERRRAAKR